jgi:hypothetical protein
MKPAAKAGLALVVMLGAWRMEAGVGASATNLSPTTATIRRVSVLGAGTTVEVEVVASQPIQAQTLVITGPDRLILDFPNAVPDKTLRNVNVGRGELKGIRVGRFSSDPPITRVVLDLKSAQPFQLFPAGKSVIVKLAAAPAIQVQPGAPAATSFPTPAPVAPPRKVEVNYSQGKLRVWANKATLAEVMEEIHRRTGAAMTMPPGSGQDQIVADLGPAAPRQVLAELLNGSPFNFVIVGADNDPSQLRGIYLTTRQGGFVDSGVSYPATVAGRTPSEPDQAMAAPDNDVPPPEPPPANPDQEMVPNQPEQPENPPQ